MHATTDRPAEATGVFFEQFITYARRWIRKQQSASASASAPAGPGRPCDLPAEVLWSTLLLSVLQRVRGVRDVWRALVYQGYDVCDQAVYARLERDGTEPMQALFTQMSRMLAAWVQSLVEEAQSEKVLASFARAVLALDETTLDPLARMLPQLRHFKKGTVELLPGKLATLFDVRLQLWQRIDFVADVQQNCKVHARAMLSGLEQGTLLLFDLGYFGFEWLDDLTKSGLWYVSRLREKTSYTLVHTLYESQEVFDGLVWLGKHQARAGQMVRLVRLQVNGSTHEYLTNVLDPQVLSVGEVVQLYARRWDIELAFLLLKEHLQLHLWWQSKLTGILQQLWACLIIAQLLQALRMEIAVRAQVDPFEVSMPLVVRSLPSLLHSGQDPIALLVRRGRQLGVIRPSRRVQVQVPLISATDIVPRPADLLLERPACYPADPGKPGRKSSNARHQPKGGPPIWQEGDLYEWIAQ